jgi:hypothetical protein
LSRNPWISPMTLIVLSPDSFYFILALWLWGHHSCYWLLCTSFKTNICSK